MVDIHDIIMYVNFGDDRLIGLGMAVGQILAFPIDFDRRPYNTRTTQEYARVWCSTWHNRSAGTQETCIADR